MYPLSEVHTSIAIPAALTGNMKSLIEQKKSISLDRQHQYLK